MKIPMSAACDFELQHSVVADGHVCRCEAGFDHAQIRLILRGACDAAKTGDALYIPAHLGYSLVWRGEEGAEFYTLEFHVGADVPLSSEMTAFPATELSDLFPRLAAAIAERDTFLSASLFYSVLAFSLGSIGKSRVSSGQISPAVAYIGEHFPEKFRVGDLAAMCCISESRFFPLFKAEMGMSPIDYRNELRVRRADFYLADGHSIEEVSEMLGFCSPAHFRRTYKKHTGATPKKSKGPCVR